MLDERGVGRYSDSMKRYSVIRPERIAVIALLALAGCGLPNDQPITPPYVSAFELFHQSEQCLTGVFDRTMADHYAGKEDASIMPTGPQSPVVSSAIDQCVAGFDLQDSNGQWVLRGFTSTLAMEAQGRVLDARSERRREIYAANAAENQAKLKAEEPDVLDNYRNCIFTNAARLAVVSEEPADVVVRATYSACRPQRTALVELHKRYGDPGFDDERMNRIEDGVAGALILTVIRARATQRAAPAPETPTPASPTPASPPRPKEHSI
jgi:hypothetical protein